MGELTFLAKPFHSYLQVGGELCTTSVDKYVCKIAEERVSYSPIIAVFRLAGL